MISPSTATDPLEPLAHEAERRIDDLTESAPAVLRGLTSGVVVHADFFAETSLRSLADARVRVERGRPSPPTFRIRDTLDAGFSLHAFGNRCRHLVWSDSLEDQALSRAAERLAVLLKDSSTPARVASVATGADGAARSRVRQESWRDFVVERLVDSVLSADADVVEVRIRRLMHDRRISVVSQSDQIRRSARRLSSLQLIVSLGDHSGVAIGEGDLADPEALVQDAVSMARERQSAVPLDVERAPIVFAGGRGGVWLHEALGHALEADTVRANETRMEPGDRIAPEWLTVTDDPGLEQGRGTCTFDDEASPATVTTLVERGSVRSVLTDHYHAHLSGLPLTGNGRRASFRDFPLPRMTNLVMSGGTVDEHDLLVGAEGGIYVSGFQEGRLCADGRTLQLTADRAFRIRAGRLAEPIRDVSLAVSPRALLAQLRAAGRVASTDPARGVCSKQGQSLPVSIAASSAAFNALRLARTA